MYAASSTPIAHHEQSFTLGLNQNAFGGAYYASALIHLIRGGADLEMRWTATSKRSASADDAYGLMSIDGEPTPACLAKQLFAQHVRYGDCIRFPAPPRRPTWTAIVAWDDARAASAACSSIRQRRPCTLTALRLGRRTRQDCSEVLRMDAQHR